MPPRWTLSYSQILQNARRGGQLVDLMDVCGNIDAILAKKGGETFSIRPDATVFEAIELMDEKNVGALPVMEASRLVGMISCATVRAI